MYVVFESGILEDEDEMTTELLVGAGVQVENIVCGAFNSVNLHQFVTNVLPMNIKILRIQFKTSTHLNVLQHKEQLWINVYDEEGWRFV